MTSVPMKLPSTTLFDVPAKPIRTPSWRLPEIRLRAAAVVPPTVLLCAPNTMSRPLSALGTGDLPVMSVPMKSFCDRCCSSCRLSLM